MSLRDQLLAARPQDPLILWMVAERPAGALSASADVVRSGANVAWRGRAARPGEQWVTGIGEDAAVVCSLVEDLATRHEPDGVTVSESAFAALPQWLRSPDPGHWSLWTRQPGADRVSPGLARSLAPDDARIAPLLAHSESAHVFPGDDRIVQWAGVEEGGDLLSVAARLTEPSGAAHLVSVCTDPMHRGRGLAEQACARLIVDADGAPICVLEMYAANAAGRALYSRLGFAEQGRYFSGLLAR